MNGSKGLGSRGSAPGRGESESNRPAAAPPPRPPPAPPPPHLESLPRSPRGGVAFGGGRLAATAAALRRRCCGRRGSNPGASRCRGSVRPRRPRRPRRRADLEVDFDFSNQRLHPRHPRCRRRVPRGRRARCFDAPPRHQTAAALPSPPPPPAPAPGPAPVAMLPSGCAGRRPSPLWTDSGRFGDDMPCAR